MGIPGEDLPGSWAATEFVAWYNGHPDYRDLEFDLSAERAVVVGNGNVAADVARMLALTRDELAETDVADHALEVLAESNVTGDRRARPARPGAGRVHQPGAARARRDDRRRRVRGPAATSSSTRSAEGVHRERGRAHHREEERRDPDRLRRRASRSGKRRRIVLRFLVSPVEILGDERVEGIRIVPQRAGRRTRTARCARAPPTSRRSSTAASCSARSATAAPASRACPSTSARGVIPNDGGRIRRARTAGEYAVGWIKRGPTGIIGTNKRDAQETVDALLEDLDAGRLPRADRPGPRLARGAARRAPARRT